MDEMTQAELEARVEAMSDEEQAHFRLLIMKLVLCYGESPLQAVVVMGSAQRQVAGVLTVNADEMDAAQLMQAASSFFVHINTEDAPPKEMFN